MLTRFMGDTSTACLRTVPADPIPLCGHMSSTRAWSLAGRVNSANMFECVVVCNVLEYCDTCRDEVCLGCVYDCGDVCGLQ
jgi:hypothetical protein